MICSIAYYYHYTLEEIGNLDLVQCNILLDFVKDLNSKDKRGFKFSSSPKFGRF
jgi:hypothetical protein